MGKAVWENHLSKNRCEDEDKDKDAAGSEACQYKWRVFGAKFELFQHAEFLQARHRVPCRGSGLLFAKQWCILFLSECEKDKESDNGGEDRNRQQHIEHLVFILLLQLRVLIEVSFFIWIHEDAWKEETDKHSKHIHLCTNHGSYGALIVWEPVCGHKRRWVVQEDLSDGHNELTNEYPCEAGIDCLADPAANASQQYASENAPAQAEFIDKSDGWEVDWQIDHHIGIGANVDHNRFNTV